MAKLKETKDEIIGALNPQYWVQKSDPLVLMRSVPFSLGELKILDTYISRINAANVTRRTVIFTKEEYEELMGVACIDYRTLKKHTEGMLGKIVTLEMPNKDFLKFVLFTKAYYHKDDYGVPIIELTCSEEAKDLFFCIGKYHYFKYALENVINLTRKSSYLLYVYILPNRYRKNWRISLSELRDTVLDCKGQSSYLAFKEFKRAVLDPAVNEINKKTDCSFKYKTIKRGRKVVEIEFIYHSSEINENQLTFEDMPEHEADYDVDNKLGLLAEAVENEFTPTQMDEIFQNICLMPLDENPHGIDLARYHYLSQMYAKLNTAAERSAYRGKPIKDRYKYFITLLKKEQENKK